MKRQHQTIYALTLVSCSVAQTTLAEGSSVHSAIKVLAGGNMFYYSDENKQGGKDLPGGSTMLSIVNVQYNDATYYGGLGLFYHMDQVGKNQSNAAMGIKCEFYVPAMPYYVELGYAFSAKQTFVNRAAESREGSMSYFGLGLRVSLSQWIYFDGSIKQRQWGLTKEDGVELAERITKTELLPFLGLGVAIPI